MGPSCPNSQFPWLSGNIFFIYQGARMNTFPGVHSESFFFFIAISVVEYCLVYSEDCGSYVHTIWASELKWCKKWIFQALLKGIPGDSCSVPETNEGAKSRRFDWSLWQRTFDWRKVINYSGKFSPPKGGKRSRQKTDISCKPLLRRPLRRAAVAVPPNGWGLLLS